MDKENASAFLCGLQELCIKYNICVKTKIEHGPMDGHFGSPVLYITDISSNGVNLMINEILYYSPKIVKRE